MIPPHANDLAGVMRSDRRLIKGPRSFYVSQELCVPVGTERDSKMLHSPRRTKTSGVHVVTFVLATIVRSLLSAVYEPIYKVVSQFPANISIETSPDNLSSDP